MAEKMTFHCSGCAVPPNEEERLAALKDKQEAIHTQVISEYNSVLLGNLEAFIPGARELYADVSAQVAFVTDESREPIVKVVTDNIEVTLYWAPTIYTNTVGDLRNVLHARVKHGGVPGIWDSESKKLYGLTEDETEYLHLDEVRDVIYDVIDDIASCITRTCSFEYLHPTIDIVMLDMASNRLCPLEFKLP